jgi:hypothetical protein
MHLRKLVPLADLLDGGGARPMAAAPASRPVAPAVARPSGRPATPPAGRSAPAAPTPSPARSAPPDAVVAAAPPDTAVGTAPAPDADRDRFLAAIKSGKVFFYNAVVAQAFRIEASGGRVTFSFLPNQKVPRAQCDENRPWLEALASQTFGRAMQVQVVTAQPGETAAPAPAPGAAAAKPAPERAATGASEDDLRKQALSDPMVQDLLEIFPVERTKVEEM